MIYFIPGGGAFICRTSPSLINTLVFQRFFSLKKRSSAKTNANAKLKELKNIVDESNASEGKK